MNLRHLRYFVVLAERLNFTAAARELGIAQPPLSVQIRNLEAEAGGALFYRERRRIRLTPLGFWLLDEARALLEHAEKTAERLRDAAAGRPGEIRIGYTQGALSEKVTRRIRKFLRRQRGIRVETRRLSYPAAVESLDADLVITESLKTCPPGFMTLEHARLELALPPKHRLSDRAEIHPADLLGESLLLAPPAWRAPGESHLLGILDSKHLTVNRAPGPESFADRLWQVSLGLGLAVCTSAERGSLDAVRVPLADSPDVLTVCQANPKSRSTALPLLVEAIRA